MSIQDIKPGILSCCVLHWKWLAVCVCCITCHTLCVCQLLFCKDMFLKQAWVWLDCAWLLSDSLAHIFNLSLFSFFFRLHLSSSWDFFVCVLRGGVCLPWSSHQCLVCFCVCSGHIQTNHLIKLHFQSWKVLNCHPSLWPIPFMDVQSIRERQREKTCSIRTFSFLELGLKLSLSPAHMEYLKCQYPVCHHLHRH